MPVRRALRGQRRMGQRSDVHEPDRRSRDLDNGGRGRQQCGGRGVLCIDDVVRGRGFLGERRRVHRSYRRIGDLDVVRVDVPNGLTSVSCPSTSWCLAADNAGRVLWSSNPTGGATNWHAVNVDGSKPGRSPVCRARPLSFCLAVDSVGDVVFSTDPSGGAAKSACSERGRIQSDQRCVVPVPSFCLAVDSMGDVVFSTGPVRRSDEMARGCCRWIERSRCRSVCVHDPVRGRRLVRRRGHIEQSGRRIFGVERRGDRDQQRWQPDDPYLVRVDGAVCGH